MYAATPRASFVLYIEGTDPSLCSTYLEIESDPLDIKRRHAVGQVVKATVLAIVGDRNEGSLVYLLTPEAVEAWPFWDRSGDPGKPIGRLRTGSFEDVAQDRSSARRELGEEDDQEILSDEILTKKVWRLATSDDDLVVRLGQRIREAELPVPTWDLGADQEVAITTLVDRLIGTSLEGEAKRWAGWE